MMQTEDILRLIKEVSACKVKEFSYEEGAVRLHIKGSETEMPGQVINDRTADRTAGRIADRTADRITDSTEQKPEDCTANVPPSGEHKQITSPLVGTFYRASGEQEPPFVSVGDRVKKGQIVAIVEAMKLMNEIESDADGIIECIHVENEQPVEYGQPLFTIRPIS